MNPLHRAYAWGIAVGLCIGISFGYAAYAYETVSEHRELIVVAERSYPRIRGFNPDYQYHGIQRGGGNLDMKRNETRREYNKRCAYNPAVCVRNYRSYE